MDLMRITLFLCFVCVGQVFGHKGMLREKEALDAAHRRGEAYTLKPGCFFVDPVIEEQNDHYRSRSGLRSSSVGSSFGGQNTVEGRIQNAPANPEDFARGLGRQSLDTTNTSTSIRPETRRHLSVPNSTSTSIRSETRRHSGVPNSTSTPIRFGAGRHLGVPNSTSTSIRFGAGRHLENLSAINSTPTPIRSETRRHSGVPNSTSTPIRRETSTLNDSADIETQLEAWSRERIPEDFEWNAQDALKCAVKKVYAERRLVQLPEDGLYVDINAILQDPHLDLWGNCFENVVSGGDLDRTLRRLFDELQRQYLSPDMIVTTHYDRIPGLLGFQDRTDHCFALFQDFLMTSGAYTSARESIAKPLIYLLRKVSALEDNDDLKVRFVDLVKDAMTACQDRVLVAVEELCSMAVSAALDDNQLHYEDSDRERAQMSVILSLQKRRLIQEMPLLRNQSEGIEYALNAVRLADRVFPMGSRLTEQNFMQGTYGVVSPKELAEAICITDVNQLADLLLGNATWDSLMNQKPSCSALQERYCEIDPGDLGGAGACALGDQIKEAKRRETIIALGTHGYLTADRNYPVSPIL
jgi:hypothetical protein